MLLAKSNPFPTEQVEGSFDAHWIIFIENHPEASHPT